jgi:hypothetical protein
LSRHVVRWGFKVSLLCVKDISSQLLEEQCNADSLWLACLLARSIVAHWCFCNPHMQGLKRIPTNVIEAPGKPVLIRVYFPCYMVPLLDAVKAEIVRGGSGKKDYRHHSRTGCVEKRQVAQWCFCDPHIQVPLSAITDRLDACNQLLVFSHHGTLTVGFGYGAATNPGTGGATLSSCTVKTKT